MNPKLISEVLYFWMFMLGVLIFGRVFGGMRDTKSMVIILVAAALVYVVWRVARAKGRAKRAEREFEAGRKQPPQKARSGKNPSHKGKNKR